MNNLPLRQILSEKRTDSFVGEFSAAQILSQGQVNKVTGIYALLLALLNRSSHRATKFGNCAADTFPAVSVPS